MSGIKTTAMWYLLYGLNDIARDEEVAKLKAKMGDDEIAQMNITWLDAGAPFKDIQSACDTVSFLAEKRMVIVRNWLTRTGAQRRKGSKDTDDNVNRLTTYLP